VTNLVELTAAELDCTKRVPNQCMRVAEAYETGKIVQTDATKSERARKIALTFYVRNCLSGDGPTCYQLARLYDTGEMVRKNVKNADALRQRAADLCEKETSPVCARVRELVPKK
jgi:TPR repeat protein